MPGKIDRASCFGDARFLHRLIRGREIQIALSPLVSLVQFNIEELPYEAFIP